MVEDCIRAGKLLWVALKALYNANDLMWNPTRRILCNYEPCSRCRTLGDNAGIEVNIRPGITGICAISGLSKHGLHQYVYGLTLCELRLIGLSQ